MLVLRSLVRQLPFVLKLGRQPASLVLFLASVLVFNKEDPVVTSFFNFIGVTLIHNGFYDLEVVYLFVDAAIIEELLPINHAGLVFGLF